MFVRETSANFGNAKIYPETGFERALEVHGDDSITEMHRSLADPKWKQHFAELDKTFKEAISKYRKMEATANSQGRVLVGSENEYALHAISQRAGEIIADERGQDRSEYKRQNPSGALHELMYKPEFQEAGKKPTSDRPKGLPKGTIRILYCDPDNPDMDSFKDVKIADFIKDKNGEFKDCGDKAWRATMAINADNNDGVIEITQPADEEMIPGTLF